MLRILLCLLLMLTRALSVATRMSSTFVKHSLGSADSNMELAVVPMFSDNYGYILIDKERKEACLVDPADPPPVMSALKEMGVTPTQLWCTHYHADHQGGNAAFKSAYPDMEILGPSKEKIDVIDRKLEDGTTFKFGDMDVSVMHVPCHTKGHIAFYGEKKSGGVRILAAGDNLFAGGCGRFFEGTAEQMLNNMDRLGQLPEDTVVCPAHEYTEANYRFLNSLDPAAVGAVFKQVQATRAEGKYTVPTTIGAEKKTNYFMKCNEAHVQAVVADAAGVDVNGNAVQTMQILREMKNAFK